MMDKELIIRTNLNRAILIGLIALISMFVFYLIDQNKVSLFILIALVVIFMQYLFSKKVFRIIVNNQDVKFEYLKLYKREWDCLIGDLYVKNRIEVHFRGGKNEVFEIFNKKNNKKMFEINKRLFKSETDYKSFTNLFPVLSQC